MRNQIEDRIKGEQFNVKVSLKEIEHSSGSEFYKRVEAHLLEQVSCVTIFHYLVYWYLSAALAGIQMHPPTYACSPASVNVP